MNQSTVLLFVVGSYGLFMTSKCNYIGNFHQFEHIWPFISHRSHCADGVGSPLGFPKNWISPFFFPTLKSGIRVPPLHPKFLHLNFLDPPFNFSLGGGNTLKEPSIKSYKKWYVLVRETIVSKVKPIYTLLSLGV